MSMNQAIVRGTMSSEPEFRVLASGTSLATLQLTTRPADGHAIRVPISITEPPAWLATAVAGDEVLVVGVVRRRFFRAGSATASRVEVEARVVAKTSTSEQCVRPCASHKFRSTRWSQRRGKQQRVSAPGKRRGNCRREPKSFGGSRRCDRCCHLVVLLCSAKR